MSRNTQEPAQSTRRCLNILVAGGYDPDQPEALDRPVDDVIEFARMLGRQIIRQGHNLLNGCLTDLDRVVAEAAQEELKARSGGHDPKSRLRSYLLEGKQPVHECGSIMKSDHKDWDIGGREPTPPEVVRYADAVVLLGGFFGTFQAANWARLSRKPLLPFASFGGTAKEVYRVEADRFDEAYAANVDRLEYDEVLKSISRNWEELAARTVALAEKIVTPRTVFVIMSFKDAPEYRDLYKSIGEVCEEFDYRARRVDESNLRKRIIPEIIRQVRESAFVIADVTEGKPNVYYELGYADGLGKEVILTAKKGTELPFDINDMPVVFWEGFSDFEEELRKHVGHIGSFQGR
ncbi:MAG TPA: hypothetical protein VFR81_22520 [Longimicrobium sp.]|nr:hypothetical protein [Longimicrobium sp.]